MAAAAHEKPHELLKSWMFIHWPVGGRRHARGESMPLLAGLDNRKLRHIELEVSKTADVNAVVAAVRVESDGAVATKQVRRVSRTYPASLGCITADPRPHQRRNSESAALFRAGLGSNEASLLRPPIQRYNNPRPSHASVLQSLAPMMAPVAASAMEAPVHGPVDPESRHTIDAGFISEPTVKGFTAKELEYIARARTNSPDQPPLPAVGCLRPATGNFRSDMACLDSSTAPLALSWERIGLDRARRPSLVSSVSTSSFFSSRESVPSTQESFESRPGASSISNQTTFESIFPRPTANLSQYVNYHPQSLGYNSTRSYVPSMKQPVRRKSKPGEIFAAFPGDVLKMILGNLRALHLQPGSISCATCWMRDCCAVALCARKFLEYSRVSLYEEIQIVGADSYVMKKRTKLAYGARLTLLRRTLRANEQVAAMVRTLKVPSQPVGVGLEEYNNLVASVIMALPNLESLDGYYPAYDHSFSKLFQALAKRSKLKEIIWVLEASPFQRQRRIQPIGGRLVPPGDLQPFQSTSFLQLHMNWRSLTALTIHCHPGSTLTPDSLLEDVLRYLPSLQILHLSNLPQTSFHDRSLLALPPLKRLTLAHMPGITTDGLASFAGRRSASSHLTSLTLIHINVSTLPVIARIFSNLSSLKSFNMVQSTPPIMPTDETIWLFPYLVSATLIRLHWDMPYPSAADSILAKSIAANGFPALRFLRTPNDPEGEFQALCYPLERIDAPSDRYRGEIVQLTHADAAPVKIRHANFGRGHTYSESLLDGIKNPKATSFPSYREPSNLHQARLAAQARLEVALRFPRYFVNVIDEESNLVENFGIGAFIGTVESKISYVLQPDAGATDECGGLVGVAKMLGDCGEELFLKGVRKKKETNKIMKEVRGKTDGVEGGEAQVREGCSGRWNAYSGKLQDKKDKERWFHVERGRWRVVALS